MFNPITIALLILLSVSQPMTVEATAYVSEPPWYDMTATGVTAEANHTIAVDPEVIPYGGVVCIPSLGQMYIAEDCGGEIQGAEIDIYMLDRQEALEFGRQELVVWVWEVRE